MLDSACQIASSVISSLKLGTVRRCSFSVRVRRDVFELLFSNCGSAVRRKPGKMYSRSDFSAEYFNDSDFVYRNDCNECVSVDFPVLMYSYVKFVRLCDCVDFCETVCVTLVKKRC